MKKVFRHKPQLPQWWFNPGVLICVLTITKVWLHYSQTTVLDIGDQLIVSFSLAFLLIAFPLRYLKSIQFLGKPIKRILVADYNTILSAGIENLLRPDETMVLRILTPNDEFTLIDEIVQFRPHTVILAGYSPLIDAYGLMLMLDKHPQIRFITVDVKDDQIHILEKKQVTIQELNDFTSVVCEEGGQTQVLEEAFYVRG